MSTYLSVPDLTDVLREQLEYLIEDHLFACPVPNCPDCERMKVIAGRLMEPFRERIIAPLWRAKGAGA